MVMVRLTWLILVLWLIIGLDSCCFFCCGMILLNYMKKNFVIKLFIIFSIVFFFENSVFASSLSLDVAKSSFQEGEVFVVDISLNTEGESINTIEGGLKYDASLINAEAVNIGSSFVSLWMSKPDVKSEGIIRFSGIIPGGIVTSEGELFKVVFKTKKIGKADIFLENVNLFLNNGIGTIISPKIKNVNININKGKSTDTISDVVLSDKESPEKFVITRTKDQSIYDNKWFIAFNAVDKGLGVDHYRVCEFYKCMTGESPFILWNQTPFYRIVVSAYDMNGNYTSSTLTSPYLVLLLLALILIIFILFVFFYRRYLFSNRV
jgi:hypothetical protein